jgi:hypothetical protein
VDEKPERMKTVTILSKGAEILVTMNIILPDPKTIVI